MSEVLKIVIGGDTKKFDAALQQIKDKNKKLEQDLISIGKRATVAFAAIGGTIGLAVKQFADFEKGLIGVGKTTGIAGKELDDLGDSVLELSKRLPNSTSELLEISQAAGQLGVQGKNDIIKFTEVMAKLASASDVAGEDGAKAIARLLTVTGDGIQNIDRFAAALVDLGNNAAASESEILDTANRVGGNIARFDAGSEAVLGISTALKALGKQSELSGTVIGRSFEQIDQAIRGGGEQLAKLSAITGMTGEQLRKTFAEDSASVFQAFINGLSRANDEGVNVTQVLESMGLRGVRVNDILGTLIKSNDVLNDSLARSSKAWDENSALDEEAEAAIKSLSAQFGILRNRVVSFAIRVGKIFAPAISSAIKLLQKMISTIQENKAFVVLTATVLGLGAAVTGLTATLAFGAVGIIKFKKALDVAIISIKAMSFSIKGLVAATGLGLLLILLTDLAINWETRWKQMTAIFRGFAKNVSQIGLGLKNVLQGIFTFDKDQIVKGFNELKEAISKSFNDVGENFRLINQEQLAQDEELAQESAENIVEIKRNLNAKDADLIQSRNDRIKKLNDELRQAEYESRLEDSEIKKEQELEHQAAMLELRNEYRNLDLQAEQEIEAEKTKAELEEKKRRIKEEKKYGKTVADLKAMLRHEDVQGAKEASNELIQLQSSESETLKGIGKAAALVRVGIKTAEGAISAYSALAGIPIVGPGLGAAAAAALIAFGGEQAAKITAANQGGVITGGIAGVDSVPAMLTPGELVTPEKNFDEVVNAVANQRMQESGQVSGDGTSGPAEIVLSLKDDLVEFIEAQLIERGRLNIGLGIA